MPATRAKYYEAKRDVTPDPYDAFCVAIVKRAIDDYKSAAKRYKRAEEENKALCRKKMNEIEKFFLSDKGQLFSFGYGERIVEELRQARGAI